MQWAQEKRVFFTPRCPRRVRTHTSATYHPAISTCQLHKDFSPRVSKLEMLFRLQKQLHVFCFLSQRRMQMKGAIKLPGMQLTPHLLAWRKHTPMEGELAPGKAAHGEMLWPSQPVLTSVLRVPESYCRALQFTESNFLWPLHQPEVIFLLSFFLPSPYSLIRSAHFTTPYLPTTQLKGGKKDKPCMSNHAGDPVQILQISWKFSWNLQ